MLIEATTDDCVKYTARVLRVLIVRLYMASTAGCSHRTSSQIKATEGSISLSSLSSFLIKTYQYSTYLLQTLGTTETQCLVGNDFVGAIRVSLISHSWKPEVTAARRSLAQLTDQVVEQINGSDESAAPSPVSSPVRSEPTEVVRCGLKPTQKLRICAADDNFSAESYTRKVRSVWKADVVNNVDRF